MAVFGIAEAAAAATKKVLKKWDGSTTIKNLGLWGIPLKKEAHLNKEVDHFL